MFQLTYQSNISHILTLEDIAILILNEYVRELATNQLDI